MKLIDWIMLMSIAAMFVCGYKAIEAQADGRRKLRDDRRDELMIYALNETRDDTRGGWILRTPEECINRYDSAMRKLGYDPGVP